LGKRPVALLATIFFAVAGILVGASTANAAEPRKVRIWFSAPVGVGYAGTVCTRATVFTGSPFVFDLLSEQCDTSVTVGDNDHIDIPVPPEYDGQQVTVDVTGQTNELFYSQKTWRVRPPADFTGEYWDCFRFTGSLATFNFKNHCNYSHPQVVPATEVWSFP
jgi:hypothetical protein